MLIEPGRLELVDVARPEPGPEDVVLRVRAALTCGTDLKAYLRGHPKWPMPTTLGHEFSGEICEVGSAVRGFREGDAVMAAPTGPCGHCYWCGKRQENLCESLMSEMVLGGYAEFVRLPARVVRSNLFSKPPDLAFPEAALLEPLSCVVHGLGEVTIAAGDTVVLLGAGAIALLHLLVLRSRGIDDVWVVARRPVRAEAARRLGARRVLAVDASDALPAIREGTAGRGADLVIECTGQKAVWEVAPSLARKGGAVVFFGGCPAGTQVSFDAGILHYDQVRVSSPFHFTPRAVRVAYDLLTSGAIVGGPLFSGTIPLERLEAAFHAMRGGTGIKFVVEP